MSTTPTANAPISGAVLLHDGLEGRRRAPASDGHAPSAAALEALARAALSAPDHGLLHPFRLVAVAGDARERLADALATDLASRGMDRDEARGRGRAKAFAAPCLLAIVASPRGGKIPAWEQVASATCAGYAVVLRAQELGLGSVWKSPAQRDGAALRAFFVLADEEELLGWVLLGSPEDELRPTKRQTVEIAEVLSVLEA